MSCELPETDLVRRAAEAAASDLTVHAIAAPEAPPASEAERSSENTRWRGTASVFPDGRCPQAAARNVDAVRVTTGRPGVRLGRPRDVAGAPLTAVLRERTRHAHRRAEAAFALERRLVSRGAYADLLGVLRGFYRPVEHALADWDALRGALSLGMARRSRAHLLDTDLEALGRPPADVRPSGDGRGRAQDEGATGQGPTTAPPVLTCPEDALGWLYVVEGSALGGRVVALSAQAALGATLPVAFFQGAGLPDLGGRWRLLRHRLDELGAHGEPDVVDRVVEAAERAFDRLVGSLGAGGDG